MTPADFRAWQARMGLTVRAAADLLGVAPSTVQDWRTYPSGKRGWVKHCRVGNPADGVVFKDYRIRMEDVKPHERWGFDSGTGT